MLVINDRIAIPIDEFQFEFARSGGPGGQNVNKVSSKVELRWNPRTSSALSEADRAQLLERLASKLTNDGELIITSQATRDQAKNRDDAHDKLVLILRSALHRDKPRRKTKPSRASKRRRIEGKRHRAEIKKNRRID